MFGSFRCFSSLAGARASVSVGCCQRVTPFSVLSLTAGRSSRYFSSPSPSPHASLTEPSVAVTESDVHISVCSAASISSGSPDPLAIVFLTEEQADTRFQQPLTLAWLPDEYASPTPSVLRDFLGKAGTLQSLYGKFGTVAPQRVVFVGLGPAKSLSLDALRMATHAAMTVCRDCKVQGASFYFSGLTSSSSPAVAAAVEAIVRTIILSNDAFDVHRKERSHRIKSVRIMLDTPAACSAPSGGDVASGSTEFAPDAAAVLLSQVERSVQNAKIVARATVFARYLANLRADVATPSFLERQAEMVSQAQSLPLTVVTETELRAQGLHLLASVGQAAQDHARLLVLEHRGNADDPEAWVALVGKGITFDTGGLNLKTGDSMYDMHLDMSGAAAVLATVQAVAKLGLRLNVVGVLAVAENAINNRALRPRSILPSAKGSVEVSNTDAEGRLALADAFVYAQKRYSPFQLIDLATLTGAVVRALGEQTAGLFSNDAGLSAQLIQAGMYAFFFLSSHLCLSFVCCFLLNSAAAAAFSFLFSCSSFPPPPLFLGLREKMHRFPLSCSFVVLHCGSFLTPSSVGLSYISSRSTYERCWPMPVLKEHIEELKGTHSDWKTIGSGNAGAYVVSF